jgi:hypothetical protein
MRSQRCPNRRRFNSVNGRHHGFLGIAKHAAEKERPLLASWDLSTAMANRASQDRRLGQPERPIHWEPANAHPRLARLDGYVTKAVSRRAPIQALAEYAPEMLAATRLRAESGK